ncbi:MAG: hypothetical protein ACKO83_06200 [Roseiflexaceae bacterium]
MYEHHRKPLISQQRFLMRMLRHILMALALTICALGLGIAGYHYFEDMPWIDATLNAAMILGGMGPVDHVNSDAGKLFASAYALFSGLFFIAIAGIVLAPVTHRLLHSLHVDETE